MKIRVLFSLVVWALPSSSPTAHAKTINTKGNSPTQVEGRCGNNPGGVYSPPSKNGVYACLNGDAPESCAEGNGKFATTC